MVILTAGWEMYSEAAALDMLLFSAAEKNLVFCEIIKRILIFSI
jgi:hypothetical protein